MKKWLATLSLSTLALLTPSIANADVMIAPTRVVFENGDRSAELVIVNKGEEDELKVYASYVCTNMDQRNNWGTGIQTLQYVMPPGRTTATIK